MKPGAKGLSMNQEQWTRLVAGIDALNAALEASGSAQTC
jgi:hypothetical protein